MKVCEDKAVLEVLEACENAILNTVLDVFHHDLESVPDLTPIEQIVFFKLSTWLRFMRPGYLEFSPQVTIGPYRVDFLVTFNGVKYVIECDGHDFHERTKEQAQKDKKRDRDLQNLGYKVFRFTGSEIWTSRGKCVVTALGIP